MAHEAGEVPEVAPELIELLARAVDGHRLAGERGGVPVPLLRDLVGDVALVFGGGQRGVAVDAAWAGLGHEAPRQRASLWTGATARFVPLFRSARRLARKNLKQVSPLSRP
jgi:hypothetical protein